MDVVNAIKHNPDHFWEDINYNDNTETGRGIPYIMLL